MSQTHIPPKPKRQRVQQEPVVSPVIIAVVVAVVLIGVGGLIWLGNQSATRSQAPPIEVVQGEVDLSAFPSKGDPNAPVTLVEFSDYG